MSIHNDSNIALIREYFKQNTSVYWIFCKYNGTLYQMKRFKDGAQFERDNGASFTIYPAGFWQWKHIDAPIIELNLT